MVVYLFFISFVIIFLTIFNVAFLWPKILYSLILIIPLFLIGIYDLLQRRWNILRLYPLIGHLRYILQSMRPQIQQYFIETNQNGRPFSREERELVYQRSTKTLDTLPFGTQRNVYEPGFDSIHHSITPKTVAETEKRVVVGGPQCRKPYSASRLNISGMSFGALSKNAILALNRGAKMGDFAQNTGEGGLTEYHLREGGDLIWQIGSGYFGCRNKDGRFEPSQFKDKAQNDRVKMIEVKLSQGAEPGHGGILPGVKVTREIANIRGIESGKDYISPAAHSEFDTPKGLLEFLARLRDLSGGKPVGFKLCIGTFQEFLGICKAILETSIYPDFITIDGAEGGTGAAPVEFTDFVGTPLAEALVFVRNALVGTGLRSHIRLMASGKIISGFDMVCKFALGADICNSARGMMFALGCVQSRRCNKNTCPTGVTTQNPIRVRAINVKDKAKRVRNYHHETIKSCLQLIGAAGMELVADFTPHYVYHRVSVDHVMRYDETYTFLKPGQLIRREHLPKIYADAWDIACADYFSKPRESQIN